MLNNVAIMGRLAADPVLRHTSTNNMPVANFQIAVNRSIVTNKAFEQEADFFNVVAWQSTAEFVMNNFTKGQQICLKGRLQQRCWVDKEGKKNYATEIIAESVYFAGYKKAG